MIFSAKTVGSLCPSSSTNSIFLSMMPPPALISLAASMSESRTVCSLIAIAPEVEFRKPSLTESPSTHVPELSPPELPLAASSAESSPHALKSNADAAIMAIAHLYFLP